MLVGGAAILANYGFREMTYDIDAVITASLAMKEAVNAVGNSLGLPNGWLNTDEYSYEHLALKGGIAINMTIFNLPRLSVGLDLDLTPNLPLEDMKKSERKSRECWKDI